MSSRLLVPPVTLTGGTIPTWMAREITSAGLTLEQVRASIDDGQWHRLVEAYTLTEQWAAADTDPNLLRHAAHWYAAVLGWPVFPLIPGDKITYKGSKGLYDATTDIDTIANWWETAPQSNIGLPAGQLIGLDVIDIDGPEGWNSLQQAQQRNLLPPVVCSTLTAHGQHLYVPHQPHRKNGVEIAPGIDVRTTGGYVLLPPSKHPDSGRYRWQQPPPHTTRKDTHG